MLNRNGKKPREINMKYCPHCDEQIRKRELLSHNDEVHPCEFCGGAIIWSRSIKLRKSDSKTKRKVKKVRI